jgi:DNA-binding CsgD family transcriptional regulator
VPIAASVRRTDEWQFRERCRHALRDLLSGIGGETFESELLAYLNLVVRADLIATAWISGDRAVRIDSLDDDRHYATLAASRIGRISLPLGATILKCAAHYVASVPDATQPNCDSRAAARQLHAAGLVEEMRIRMQLSEGRQFVAFLGHLATTAQWSAAELEHAQRSASLLQSVMIAHDRCRQRPAVQSTAKSGERSLMRSFEARHLTLRESEIATQILRGYSTSAIALRLGISENTVKVHRKHLNQKLGVHSQAELFGFAYRVLMAGESL